MPDIAGLETHKQTSLRGIANILRGSEYNRGTGCGKTARPGLHGGCRVTGIPTVEVAIIKRKALTKYVC